MSREDKVGLLVAEPSAVTGTQSGSASRQLWDGSDAWGPAVTELGKGSYGGAISQTAGDKIRTLLLFILYFIFEHTIEYAARHRLGTLSGFPGSSLCQHFMISPSPSSGHRWHSPFLCISSKSGRSIKGGSVLITILDTKSSFMSPPRQYYLYFNTSEYSH